MDRKAIAVFGGTAQGVDVADVEFRIDALTEEVQGQCHDVDVPGALAVSEQCSFHPVGSREHGGRHRAERCGPASEVAHPATLEAESIRRRTRLGREENQGVDGLAVLPDEPRHTLRFGTHHALLPKSPGWYVRSRGVGPP